MNSKTLCEEEYKNCEIVKKHNNLIKYCKDKIEELENKLYDEMLTQPNYKRSFMRGELNTLRYISKQIDK